MMTFGASTFSCWSSRLVLACLTGLIYLYVGKAFGTVTDYSLAILWGFGIDNGIRGFAPVLAKLTGSAGS